MSLFRVLAPLVVALLLPGVCRADELSVWPRDPLSLPLPELRQLATLLDAGRPRFEYKLQGGALSVSLEPGSPCTGACLTLAGKF